ncbi:MAG: HAD family phosphatase [Tepidisphaeraceae bacterium]
MFKIAPDIVGIIFDVDGTLADSMPIHFKSWQKAMADLGGSISEKEFYDMAGVTTKKMIGMLNEMHGTDVPIDLGSAVKEQVYFDMIPEVPAIQAVVDVVHDYFGKLPMAIASGGRRYVVVQTLTAIKLSHRFDVMVTADDVVHGKPDPEMFLEAARMMKVPPEKCLVFEDGDPGIEAAKRAGMKWIDVRDYGVTSSK